MRASYFRSLWKEIWRLVQQSTRMTGHALRKLGRFLAPKERSFEGYAKLVSGLGGAAGVVAISYLVFMQMNVTTATVEIIALPNTLEERGYSKIVMADEIVSVAQSRLGTQAEAALVAVPSSRHLERDCIGGNLIIKDLKSAFVHQFADQVKVKRKKEPSGRLEVAAEAIANFIEQLPFFKGRSVAIRGEVKGNSGSLLLEMIATFPDGKTYRLPKPVVADSSDNLVEMAGVALMRFAAPWLYASSTIFDDPEDVQDVLTILLDEYSVSDPSLLYSLRGFSTLVAGRDLDGAEKAVSARNDFDRALTLDSNNYWALIGNSMSNFQIYHANGTDSKAASENKAYRVAGKSLEKAMALRPDDPAVYILLFDYYYSVGDLEKSEHYKAMAFDAARRQGRYPGVVASLVQILAGDHGDFGAADNELQRYLSERPLDVGIYSDAKEVILSAAAMAATRNDWLAFNRFSRELLVDGDPCVLARLGSFLASRAGEGQSVIRQELLREADLHFKAAEEKGMTGFRFYNQWGTVLNGLVEYDEAIRKYEEAMKYYGDTAWALLNIGNVLYQKRMFKDAERKYRDSLRIATVPKAIQGYLLSQFYAASQIQDATERAAKYTEFLSNATYYGRQIGDNMKKLWLPIYAVASYAQCSMGKKEEAVALYMKVPREAEFQELISSIETCMKGLENNPAPQIKSKSVS